jgi:hypothetical protein
MSKVTHLFFLSFLLFTSAISAQNLVVNGNFSAGSTGFITDYIENSSGEIDGGEFEVAKTPHHWCFAGPDHTGDFAGKAIYFNAYSVPDKKIWQQTVRVKPNTIYHFSAWIKGECQQSNANIPVRPAILRFSINGTQIGSDFIPQDGYITDGYMIYSQGSFHEFTSSWNSGCNTSATISVTDINLDAAGNDFALDDIAFTEVYFALPVPVFCQKDKQLICHNGHTICVSNNAVKAHLAHGDCLGYCNGDKASGHYDDGDDSKSPTTTNASSNIEEPIKMLGISNEIADRIKVFPNPAIKGIFTVSSTYLASEIRVLDISGKEIERRIIAQGSDAVNRTFNLSNRTSGLYFVQVIGSEGSFITKVVKE